MRIMHWAVALLFVASLAGCQSSKMVRSDGASAAPVPAPGKAMIVFLRVSNFGGAVQSSVYQTGKDSDQFIGIVSSGTKIGWQADPGEHLFMVVGENADFMIAHLEAGKTYYALVSPRPGFWKARFSLLPIHTDPTADRNIGSADFREWMADTAWISNTPESEQWFREHEADIREKKNDYLRKWNAADPEQWAELTLKASDGS
ncbi:hypothetical protein [Dokdonella sp.]|uniref:hypothetical protein n=1 Tax=Dokdonella sp. TaxID=2291710 RepID=UPI003C5BE4FC